MITAPPCFEDLVNLLHSFRSPIDPEAVKRILEATKLRGNGWLLAHWLGFLQEIHRRRQMLDVLKNLDHNPKLKAVFGSILDYQNLRDWTPDFISSEFLAGIYSQIFDRSASYSEDGPCVRFIQAVLGEIGIERPRDSICSGLKRHRNGKRKAEKEQSGAN
jgi:hypothetical protein